MFRKQPTRPTILALTLSLLLAAAEARAAEDRWPQFRGPGGLAAADRAHVEEWSAETNVRWSVEVPGHGWSSPVVWGERVFVTSAISLGEWKEPTAGIYGNDYVRELLAQGVSMEEARRRVRERDNEISDEIPEGVRWMVYCFDAETGRLIWEREAHHGIPFGGRHRKNTYASETPAVDGERVYAYFGNVGLFAYDFEGELVWRRSWDPQPMYNDFGTSSSPIVHGGRVYVLNDSQEVSWFAAVDAATGEELWRRERSSDHPIIRSSFATPFVWENEVRTEIVTFGVNTLTSYDPDGRVLWRLGGQSAVAAPTPVADRALLLIGSGSPSESVRPIFALRPGAAGDVTLAEGETENEFVAWSRAKGGSYIPSQVLHDGILYVLYDKGFLAAYDAAGGEEHYRVRLGSGGVSFSASPWVAGGRLYCLSEQGDTFVVTPGPRFHLERINPLDEMAMATPAPVGESVYIRTASRLYRLARPEAQAVESD